MDRPPMRVAERSHHMGRSVLFQQRQRHTPMRHFILEIIRCELAFVRSLRWVVHFRDLVKLIPQLVNSSSWAPAPLDVCAFEWPLDNLYWCDRQR